MNNSILANVLYLMGRPLVHYAIEEFNMRILIIGTYLPRQCGIATFTHDLYQALTGQQQHVDILAISNDSEGNFPKEVVRQLPADQESAYAQTGAWINTQGYDCCILQHEFGIFGGSAGNYILSLIDQLQIPLITTLHTVLEHPSPDERQVIQHLAYRSQLITVMTNRAIGMLREVYQMEEDTIEMVPHGIPDFKVTAKEAKEYLGLEDKIVMLSFGLLGRGKGYELAIDAVAKVKHPDFVYIILGATHPNVIKHEGESYKNSLMQQAARLGLNGKVVFVNKYASDSLLQIYLKACDIYVTPYPNVNQMSSGTLTFALGAGAAVLSTPYWYAQDLLADGRGCLFDFNDADGLANSINELLTNPKKMLEYRTRAHAFGKSMSWPNVAKQMIKLIKGIAPQKGWRENLSKEFNNLKRLLPPVNTKLIAQRSVLKN